VKTLRNLAAGAALLGGLAVTSPVLADGMPRGPAYVAPFSWTGFYVGAHAGIGWNDADVRIPAYPFPNHSQDGTGFVGGGHVGFNLQSGSIVFGVEGDLSWSNVDSSALSGNGGTERYSIEENWRASVRGRLGVAHGRNLFYATAGVAWLDYDTRYVPLAGGTRGATTQGWTVGAGWEAAFTNELILRLEYLYADYDTERFVHLGPSFVDPTTHELRVGVSYKFGDDRRYAPLK
jgi:outer membrane immunogenic protein